MTSAQTTPGRAHVNGQSRTPPGALRSRSGAAWARAPALLRVRTRARASDVRRVRSLPPPWLAQRLRRGDPARGAGCRPRTDAAHLRECSYGGTRPEPAAKPASKPRARTQTLRG